MIGELSSERRTHVTEHAFLDQFAQLAVREAIALALLFDELMLVAQGGEGAQHPPLR